LTVTEQTHTKTSIKTEPVEIEIPESCQYCGFKNLKIYGVRIKDRTMVEVRCIRCGKPLSKVEKYV